jgi:hypothetical protein
MSTTNTKYSDLESGPFFHGQILATNHLGQIFRIGIKLISKKNNFFPFYNLGVCYKNEPADAVY